MKNKPIVWTIAGSDSGGGAGIQADLHTFQSLGVHGCSVITAVTAQNSMAVQDVMNLGDFVSKQINALAQDLPAKAIKLGLLGDHSSIESIASFLKNYSGKVVLDPVMISACGDSLLTDNVQTHSANMQKLFSCADIVTPNLHEVAALTGQKAINKTEMATAALKILAMGAKSVLIKGGHASNDKFSQDYWTNGTEAFWLSSIRQSGESFHGSGCTLASAITACLALGYDVKEALVIAKMYVNQGIRLAQKYGVGAPPVAHVGWPECADDVPQISMQPIEENALPFPSCGEEPLGLYPIVDRASWLELLLPLGVKTIQLRIKDNDAIDLEYEIKQAVAIAQKFSARLFINDNWELAIKYQAYGVHLGQEDLLTADMQKIRQSGMRVGISVHNYYELAIAHAHRPSYIGFGPVFATTSKTFTYTPKGLALLQQMRRIIDYPLVAIGGIDREKLPLVLDAGVDGVAIIASIIKAKDPVIATKEFLAII